MPGDINKKRQKFLLFWATFLPFQPPDRAENQNFKIEKNSWIYYHFTHLHYKWQWFLRYGVWQTEFFIILDCCLPFYPTNKLKNQNFEKLKKAPEDIIILHKCNQKSWSYAILFLRYGAWQIKLFFIFGYFCTFTPLTAQKIKIIKNEKNTWRYHHFTYVYQKLWSDDLRFLRYGVQQIYRRMEGWTEKVTYRGGYRTWKSGTCWGLMDNKKNF